MIDEHINNPKSIKYYVNLYLQSIKAEIKDKIVIDIPEGIEHFSDQLKVFKEFNRVSPSYSWRISKAKISEI